MIFATYKKLGKNWKNRKNWALDFIDNNVMSVCLRHFRNENRFGAFNFRKGTVTTDVGKNCPIADRRVVINGPRSNCGTQFGFNRPFPSSPGSLYQNEVRCSTFDMEMIFHSHANKTHFHKKG